MGNILSKEKYVVLKVLQKPRGSGTGGVYLVQYSSTGEKVVVKKASCVHARPEYDITKRLVGVENMIQVRDYFKNEKIKVYPRTVDTDIHEIHLEYCNLGSLDDLGERHTAAKQSIPESFIWHVLSTMAKALHVLHNGPGENNEGWTPIVHNDIHGGNILLSSSTGANAFPQVILSDFGRSREYYESESLLHRKDISDLAHTVFELCHNACEVEQGEFGYSEELESVLIASESYWASLTQPDSVAAKFNAEFVSFVEENRCRAKMHEYGGKLILEN